MANTFGFGSDTTGFSNTVHTRILKKVVETLRAGLISLPRGAVVPAQVLSQTGETFTLRLVSYPDLVDAAATNPLTEGVAPSAVKLGIDTLDFTVAQIGAWTKLTDLAEFQSPHDLSAIAEDKIARLAAQNMDAIGLTALAAVTSSIDTLSPLTTDNLLDAKAAMQARNVQPIPGVGYYALAHPYALRGLESDDFYVDAAALIRGGDLSSGTVGQWRGVTFITSSRLTATAGVYPVYFLGANSMAAGDISTLSFHMSSDAGVGNELQQLKSVGFKAIFGAKAISFAETADGAGTNDADTVRVYRIGVSDGRTDQ